MTKFKEDDRVEYTGSLSPLLKGLTGTVIECTDKDIVGVRLDSTKHHPSMTEYVLAENLTLIARPSSKTPGAELPIASLSFSSGTVIAIFHDYLTKHLDIRQPVADLKLHNGRLEIIFA
ncbi:hypothetical protein [Phyllobacterium endophyticum]|uniref:hypothetical protein n=1 Tax=Phyllobacterium endophyticum TaxID=1149773 RepID=UPI0011C91E3A|nr:hypothetical protein [Phyllobacterium endophyticum]TXR49908.1 hypothetical protein FVA77_07800 [Phyllobacterium endophyticum]